MVTGWNQLSLVKSWILKIIKRKKKENENIAIEKIQGETKDFFIWITFETALLSMLHFFGVIKALWVFERIFLLLGEMDLVTKSTKFKWSNKNKNGKTYGKSKCGKI